MKVYRNKNWHADHGGRQIYDGLFQRCDACGSFNKIGRTPEGGEWQSTTRGTPAAGYTWGDPVYPTNGCWFCGSPAWRRGGKLGDLARVK